MEGGQTGTVFVNQEDTNVDGETFNGVIGEEEYTPVDSGEVSANESEIFCLVRCLLSCCAIRRTAG